MRLTNNISCYASKWKLWEQLLTFLALSAVSLITAICIRMICGMGMLQQ